MRVLVLTAEPISADVLRQAIGDEAGDAEVMVVSPALNQSRLAFWMSDADEAIAKAQAVQEETVERLEQEGIDAAGDTGESEPLAALEDALATFPAERVVIVTHPAGEELPGERDLVAQASEQLDRPVEHFQVSA
jgi:hypothetical protein